MTRIDQFESVFKSADKPVFRYEPFAVGSALALTDLDGDGAESFSSLVRKYLDASGEEGMPPLQVVRGDEFGSIEECLKIIDRDKPELICTYRGLHSDCWRWGHSLGSYVEVLTQTVNIPVLVFPHPGSAAALSADEDDCSRVMAMTDHLAGDSRLVNAALFFTPASGTLHLSNIEDEQVFERYMAAIEKIPSVDSAAVRENLLFRILKEAEDYIQSCRAVVAEQGLEVEVIEAVELGMHVEDYRQLVVAGEIDLLVMNTREVDQLAMHGLAYTLAVELSDIPLLLL
ncbi:MAG: hypothetical protein MK554_11675 [Planctomycetes bacterium]|nr:hypothetical protein [Planctomycetota bacterium]